MALPYRACPALHCLLRDPSPVSTAAGHTLAHRRESLLLQPAVRHGQLCHRSRHEQAFQHFLAFATATWAHAHKLAHVPGRLNDWADDFSRGRLHRFMTADRVRFSPRSLAQAGRGLNRCALAARTPGCRIKEFVTKLSALKERIRACHHASQAVSEKCAHSFCQAQPVTSCTQCTGWPLASKSLDPSEIQR